MFPLVILWLAVALPLTAQRPTMTALTIVEKAVAAAGGESWARPNTLQLRGHATFYALGEHGNEIQVPTYKMWRVFPTENKAAHQANGRVRLYYDGVKWTDITWQEFEVNQPIDEAVFNLAGKQAGKGAQR